MKKDISSKEVLQQIMERTSIGSISRKTSEDNLTQTITRLHRLQLFYKIFLRFHNVHRKALV